MANGTLTIALLGVRVGVLVVTGGLLLAMLLVMVHDWRRWLVDVHVVVSLAVSVQVDVGRVGDVRVVEHGCRCVNNRRQR